MAKKLTKAKAREILHDKEVHGHPLTDKQRKFFGAVSSGYIKAQNGIEGTMGGLTDIGFNFNPAWGGAWENGGSLKKAQGGGKVKDKDQKWIQAAATQHQKCGIGTEDPTCKTEPNIEFPGMPSYENMSSASNLWNWPESRKEQKAFMSDIDARYKILSQQYPDLTKETLIATMRDSARTNQLLNNERYMRLFNEAGKLKDSTLRIEDPYIKYWKQAYPQKTKITVPDILQNLGQNIGNYPNLINTGYRRFEDGGILQPPMAGANQTVSMAQNGTKLSTSEEKKYQAWRNKLPKNLQYEGDYDLRGLWKENPNVKPSTNLHFPDTYKLPNHPTFSDESKYFNPDTRKFAGHWNETDSSWNYIPYDTLIKKSIMEKKNLAMGGALPGMTGSMYARTGAPSNGPYAKKTKASAQNGKEMSFYQAGLDFQPKTISKNGGWLDKYEEDDDVIPKAQPGKNIYPDKVKVRNANGEVTTYDRGSKEYKDVYEKGIGYWTEDGEFVSSPKTMENVTVSTKIKPNSLSAFVTDYYKNNPQQKFLDERKAQHLKEFNAAPLWARASVPYDEKRQQNDYQNDLQDYQKSLIQNISEKLMGRSPKGNQSRKAWLSDENFTPAEQAYLFNENSTLPEPNYWAQGVQGLFSLGRNLPVAANQFLPGSPLPVTPDKRVTSGLAEQEWQKYNTPVSALAPLNIIPKVVQGMYKDNYSVGDAFSGVPNNASVAEDLLTDPTNWGTFGLKGGLLKTAMAGLPFVKGASALQDVNKVGEIVQDINKVEEAVKDVSVAAPQNLPFYTFSEADDASKIAFQQEVDKLKTQLSTPRAKAKFEQLGQLLTNNTNILNIDPVYTEALFNPNLPTDAVDKFASSIISTNAGTNRLTKDQLKYAQNLGTLTTDVEGLQRVLRYGNHGMTNTVPNFTQEDIAKFIIDNSKNLSPRDLSSLIYGLDINTSQKQKFIKQLMDQYSGQTINNPIGNITGAIDLLSFVDNDALNFAPSLSSNIRASLRNILELGEKARPKASITDKFFNPMAENSMTDQATYFIRRDEVNKIPTVQERQRVALKAGRQTIEDVSRVLNNPTNKGKIFVASHSLSSDSHPLGLQLLARNKHLGEFVPIHGGTKSDIIPTNGFNAMSGLSQFNARNTNYLSNMEAAIKHKLMGAPASSIIGNANSTSKGLQNQLLLSGLSNSAIDDFNKVIGTNMPSSYYSVIENDFLRPNVGIKLHKKGGVVKDNRGQWAHPGEITEIQGDTMATHGYGDIPLYVIPNNGEKPRVIYPNTGEYYFPGATKFTEYPIAAQGVSVNRADEYPLHKLDDLLNFTNYNKKAKSGGWLNKYQ